MLWNLLLYSRLLIYLLGDSQRALSEKDEKDLNDTLHTTTFPTLAQLHLANLDKLTKGTGLWIKDDVMFRLWKEEHAPILWVFGKPGVGKTMLAARTVETLQNVYPQHTDIPSLTSVSYVYFKDDNQDLQDCINIWKAVALQIVRTNYKFKRHVLEVVKKEPDLFVSAKWVFQRLFLDFFTEHVQRKSSLTSLAFIIVDGLDEAPAQERVKFPACLAELVRRSSATEHCRIQVGIFARPDVRGDPGFERVGFRTERTIVVTPEKNTVDIEAFVRGRLKDVSLLNVLKTKKAKKDHDILARQIYTSVLSKSQGMFLWASLVFDEIWNSPSPEAIRHTLQEAPQGLDDMINHVFERLQLEERMHQSYLSKLLSCVYCAYRPLLLSELFVLLLSISSQHCWLLEDHLRGKYSSLLEVSGSSDDLKEEEGTEVLDKDDIASTTDEFDFLTQSDPDEDENADQENDDETIEKVNEHHSVISDSQQDEDSPTLPPHWASTTVAFTHARIRDYLRTEGGQDREVSRRWKNNEVVPSDLNTTTLQFAITLMQIVRSNLARDYGIDVIMALSLWRLTRN